MALGADQSQVIGLVARQSAVLVGAAVAAGLLAAVFAARWLEHVLYGVEAVQPLALIAVGAAFLGVGVLATYGPARRGSAADPMVALRAE